MKIVKGGIWRFNPTRMLAELYDEVLEINNRARAQLEFNAKMTLTERLLADGKSSGELMDSIKAVVLTQPNAIMLTLTAGAIEEGQWENQQGEGEEAAYTASGFNYAEAVEEGTGIFGPNKAPIEASDEFVFWMGDYTEKGNRKLIKTSISMGQEAKHFMRDSFLIVQPQIDMILLNMLKTFKYEAFWDKVNG